MSESKAGVLEVRSPLDGWCAPLEDCPDPVFSGRVLGDGLSIDPTGNTLHAPFDGEVVALPESRHAVSLRAGNGAECLVHLGIDTVALAGDGFEALVSVGDRVTVGQALLRFDPERVARAAPSLRTPVLLLDNPAFALVERRPEGPVAAGDPLFGVVATGAGETVGKPGGGVAHERTLRTGLVHGIHARPAALLAAAVRDLDVRVSLHRDGGTSADAGSPVSLMTLGLGHGERVRVEAVGPDAEAALAALLPLLEPLEGDGSGPAVIAGTDEKECPPVGKALPGTRIEALAASAGLVFGPAVQWSRADDPADDLPPGSIDDELAILAAALLAVDAHLAEREAGGDIETREIAQAHRSLLGDPSLADRAREAVTRGAGAARAWRDATDAVAQSFARLEDPRLRERADDIRDLRGQVLRALRGESPAASIAVPAGAIVLADELLPSELMALAGTGVAGLCLAAGGVTSHVAILAAARGLPMLVAAGESVFTIEAGTSLALDAVSGALWVEPPESEAVAFRERARTEAALDAAASAHAHEPCRTRDGVDVAIMANLAGVAEAGLAREAGADGCGLLRSEFLYMARSAPPSVEVQRRELQAISDNLGDRPLVVRLLDAGADKPIAYLGQAPEDNPALGVRGIRLALERPELLDAQLEALLRIERPTPLDVMLPMVSRVAEVDAVRARIDTLRERLRLATPLRLGVMIETPAAALLADALARRVDFFSVGTNDLAQYTLCMDRVAPSLARRLDALDPAVLTLVDRAARAAEAAGIDIGVCGAAAADPLAAPVFLGLGVRKLSMPAASIARLKARVRALEAGECATLAQDALACESAHQVRELVQARLAHSEKPVQGAAS